jgi:predicted nucleic acid-binding protein
LKVLADTSVWSLALRRSGTTASEAEARDELSRLIQSYRVVLMGPIRQELLSGIRFEEQYRTLQDRLRAFPDMLLRTEDYELAARCFNRCRARGIQGSNTDFLICAVALSRELRVYTADRDFEAYSGVLGVALHDPGS